MESLIIVLPSRGGPVIRNRKNRAGRAGALVRAHNTEIYLSSVLPFRDNDPPNLVFQLIEKLNN